MTGGYLKKKCVTCGKMIYLYRERDGRWRAYESWVAGTVPEGEWARHLCQEFTQPRVPTVGPRLAFAQARSESVYCPRR